jgi:hypothetical protein
MFTVLSRPLVLVVMLLIVGMLAFLIPYTGEDDPPRGCLPSV